MNFLNNVLWHAKRYDWDEIYCKYNYKYNEYKYSFTKYLIFIQNRYILLENYECVSN